MSDILLALLLSVNDSQKASSWWNSGIPKRLDHVEMLWKIGKFQGPSVSRLRRAFLAAVEGKKIYGTILFSTDVPFQLSKTFWLSDFSLPWSPDILNMFFLCPIYYHGISLQLFHRNDIQTPPKPQKPVSMTSHRVSIYWLGNWKG